MEKQPNAPMNAQTQALAEAFVSVQSRYQGAIRNVTTRLEILDDEFSVEHRRNPIHAIQSRMKTIPSIAEKLQRRGLEVSLDAAVENLTDIAGVRVVCAYIHDIYTVANLLTRQDDVRVVRVRDYIQNPKPNGYRSLHIVLEIPVYLREGTVRVPVEVQLRTIAMDFWASLEHSLRYKAPDSLPENISAELLQTATDISILDERMQRIHDKLEQSSRPG